MCVRVIVSGTVCLPTQQSHSHSHTGRPRHTHAETHTLTQTHTYTHSHTPSSPSSPTPSPRIHTRTETRTQTWIRHGRSCPSNCFQRNGARFASQHRLRFHVGHLPWCGNNNDATPHRQPQVKALITASYSSWCEGNLDGLTDKPI